MDRKRNLSVLFCVQVSMTVWAGPSFTQSAYHLSQHHRQVAIINIQIGTRLIEHGIQQYDNGNQQTGAALIGAGMQAYQTGEELIEDAERALEIAGKSREDLKLRKRGKSAQKSVYKKIQSRGFRIQSGSQKVITPGGREVLIDPARVEPYQQVALESLKRQGFSGHHLGAHWGSQVHQAHAVKGNQLIEETDRIDADDLVHVMLRTVGLESGRVPVDAEEISEVKKFRPPQKVRVVGKDEVIGVAPSRLFESVSQRYRDIDARGELLK